MRELILMRHAEAVPPGTGADFTRPLTARGSASAAVAALRLSQLHGAPDYLLCSPAARTSETAAAVSAALRLGPALLHSDPRIYHAPAALLLQIIAEVPEPACRLLLIAHNPAVSELASTLRGGNGRERSLRPAEFRHFGLPIEDWKELRRP